MVQVKPIILAIQNDETDAPHLVGQWLTELGFEIHVLRAFAGESVPTSVASNISALIPLGGHMNATDDLNFPWLPAERALLKDAIDRDIPIFAICLGTQLLAVAGGGRVERAKVGEVGIYSIASNDESDPIFTFDGEVPVAQWHEDFVAELPAGATLLASSELCTNQIYRIGSKSYGVQFHPEIDLSIIKKWEADADNAFIDSGKTTIQPEVAAAEAELFKTWKPIVQRWGREVLVNRQFLMNLEFSIEDPLTEDVKALLQTHLDFCHDVTPPVHSYALDVEKLRTPGITVFTARENGILLGVGALKELETGHAELKSMHTAIESRGKGVGRAMVTHLLSFARSQGLTRVSLETGSHEPFAPARKLYESFGFELCPSFGDYGVSEFTTCMTLKLN